jgi:cysteine-S-conjugate beta-lyase
LAPDFDSIIDRRGSNSSKWSKYPEDVLPLWLADMDFRAPEPILAALRAKIKHGVLGYEMPYKILAEAAAARMEKLYGWQVSPEWVTATPGIIAGFTAAAQAVCQAGEGILIQPPVYPPFVSLHEFGGRVSQPAPLVLQETGHILRYEIDFDVFEKAVGSGEARTGMFLLCNPHNPTGQVYSREELSRLAAICLEKGVVICSDEIHSELLLGGARHQPIAALSPEIAARTITLIAPSKTFNVPGLFCGFAVIPDQELRERHMKTVAQMGMHVNSLGMAAAQAAFSGRCDDWLAALRAYLTANRDFLVEYVRSELSGVRTTVPQATYLAWLDCRELVESGRITGTPHEFFLKQARVALNEGKEFGAGGEGFVRLNFGCSRATLVEALERMKAAILGHGPNPRPLP